MWTCPPPRHAMQPAEGLLTPDLRLAHCYRPGNSRCTGAGVTRTVSGSSSEPSIEFLHHFNAPGSCGSCCILARRQTVKPRRLPSRPSSPLSCHAMCPPRGSKQQAEVAQNRTVRAKLSQLWNGEGVATFFQVLLASPHLAIPHLSVPTLASIEWEALHRAGFKAILLDKDNTITQPYGAKVESQLVSSVQNCLKAFPGHVAIYSNSAGLMAYDPEGADAMTLEAAIGIPVMRHSKKKPSANVKEVEEHFGCSCHEVVLIGDRYMTDVVFGNLNGMLTIRVAPITLVGEPLTVQWARSVESRLLRRWIRAGKTAPRHPLLTGENRTAVLDFAST